MPWECINNLQFRVYSDLGNVEAMFLSYIYIYIEICQGNLEVVLSSMSVN